MIDPNSIKSPSLWTDAEWDAFTAFMVFLGRVEAAEMFDEIYPIDHVEVTPSGSCRTADDYPCELTENGDGTVTCLDCGSTFDPDDQAPA